MEKGAPSQMAMAAASGLSGAAESLTADEILQIQQYEKLVNFRDAVLSGLHPRIKPPPHALARNLVNGSSGVHPSPSTRDVLGPSSLQPSQDTVPASDSRGT